MLCADCSSHVFAWLARHDSEGLRDANAGHLVDRVERAPQGGIRDKRSAGDVVQRPFLMIAVPDTAMSDTWRPLPDDGLEPEYVPRESISADPGVTRPNAAKLPERFRHLDPPLPSRQPIP